MGQWVWWDRTKERRTGRPGTERRCVSSVEHSDENVIVRKRRGFSSSERVEHAFGRVLQCSVGLRQHPSLAVRDQTYGLDTGRLRLLAVLISYAGARNLPSFACDAWKA